MRFDELLKQKEQIDNMIVTLTDRFKGGFDFAGYRIEQEMEQDAAGVCMLRSPGREQDSYSTEEYLHMLFFLLHEKEGIVEAVSKCRDKVYVEIDDIGRTDGHRVVKRLYQNPPVRKYVQKAKDGYDIVVTETCRIDRTLLDALCHKISRNSEEIQRTIREAGRIEISYEPAIDYTQRQETCMRELKEIG